MKKITFILTVMVAFAVAFAATGCKKECGTTTGGRSATEFIIGNGTEIQSIDPS